MTPTAQEIVDSPVWKGLVEYLTEDLRTRWEAADPKDTDTIRDLSYKQRALREIVFTLERELKGSINLHK